MGKLKEFYHDDIVEAQRRAEDVEYQHYMWLKEMALQLDVETSDPLITEDDIEAIKEAISEEEGNYNEMAAMQKCLDVRYSTHSNPF